MVDASTRAYVEIKGRILSKAYDPGQHLGEEALGESIGVSRTPIREALRRLASDGLVVLKPNRGAQVKTWSSDEIEEILRIRVLLEAEAARLAATRAADSHMAKLEELQDNMMSMVNSDGADIDTLAVLNHEFHITVVQASASNHLYGILGSLLQVPLMLHSFRQYDQRALRRSIHQHEDLISAIQTRDAEWAELIMKTHVRSAQNELRSLRLAPTTHAAAPLS